MLEACVHVLRRFGVDHVGGGARADDDEAHHRRLITEVNDHKWN
jgi:hypothetical protein